MALQFKSAALRNSVTFMMFSSGTSMVLNRPPLNRGMSFTPNASPSRMAVKSVASPRVSFWLGNKPSLEGKSSLALISCSKRRNGNSPTSSAKKQNRHCVKKCETFCASWPLFRNCAANVAKLAAAASVMSRLVFFGRKLSGASQMRRSNVNVCGWSKYSSSTVWVSLGWPVNWVWMRIVRRSQTTRIGGLLSAWL